MTEPQTKELINYPTIETTVRVYYANTDAGGVVYYANYMMWFEVGREEYFLQRGGNYHTDIEEHGLALPVVEAHVRYMAPARYNDYVTIRTTITELQSRVVIFGYEIVNADTKQVLVTGWTKHLCIDLTGRVFAIPSEARNRLVDRINATTELAASDARS